VIHLEAVVVVVVGPRSSSSSCFLDEKMTMGFGDKGKICR
jgi:hypothetical protein